MVDGTLYGVPWYVDTRLLFYRRDMLARAGFTAPPRTWAEWIARAGSREARRGPGSLRDPAAGQRVRAARQPRAAAKRSAAARRRTLRQLPERRLPPRAALLRRHVSRRPRAAADQRATSPTYGTSSGAATSRSTSTGPWNIGEFDAGCRPGVQASWATAPLPGPRRTRACRSPAARAWSCSVSARSKPAAWQLIEFLSQPAVQRRFHALTGDLPPRAARGPARSSATTSTRAPFREQLERVKPTPKVPDGSASPTEIRIVAERVVARRAHGRRGGCRARRARRPRSSRSVAGCSPRAAQTLSAECRSERGAPVAPALGLLFVAPALVVIGVFFFVPVLAALALSFTDFDIYALADLAQPALRRSRQLRPAARRRRCSGRRSATRCTSWWSACRCRSRVARRGAAAAIRSSRASRRSSARRCSRPW